MWIYWHYWIVVRNDSHGKFCYVLLTKFKKKKELKSCLDPPHSGSLLQRYKLGMWGRVLIRSVTRQRKPNNAPCFAVCYIPIYIAVFLWESHVLDIWEPIILKIIILGGKEHPGLESSFEMHSTENQFQGSREMVFNQCISKSLWNFGKRYSFLLLLLWTWWPPL